MSQRPRVVLVDLHARADAFTADDGMTRLSARLAAQGLDAPLVQGVGADLGSPEVRGPLSRCISGETRAVVVARAWSEAMVAQLRSLLPPGVPLVRYAASGTRASLDDRFDHVLDAQGLLSLLGGEQPEQVEFRPRTAAELRRLRLVEAASPEAKGEVEVLAAGSTRPRPTISGPAHGCPYLKDARQSPLYASLDVDPKRVQMRGCTFCLDNSGGYAAPREDEVIEAWLSGWRAARAEDPGAREVLLTDERPHPFLPAFFRAVLADRSLWGVELMMKSRVDWLLEYGDGPLAEACELAARSGSVVHVYLVGFENFDAFHLELFNKGQSPGDNVRAIEKLRELEARFARSFEYRRYRAHGIVLFTPWTTPEALLENARWMREARFDELRSEAVVTRLRLYPRTPLYHLAERDGLLTQAFEGTRGDRAAEQGYDASAPWRFGDERTEAVFRVATALGHRRAYLGDADSLEVAVRFLERHPELCREPDVAHLPLVQALLAWSTPPALLCQELGPKLAGFDPEADAVALGLKPACLKEQVPAGDVEGLTRAYAAMGLCAAEVSRYTLDARRGDHLPGDQMAIVAVARDQSTLARVLDRQRALRAARSPDRVTEMGELMGYPPCCAQAFSELESQGENLDNERRPFLLHPSVAPHPLLSRLGALRLVSHHLCSPGCEATAARARALLEAMGEVDAEGARRLETRLASPVLFLDYHRRARLSGRWGGDRFLLESASSLDSDGPFGRALEGASWLGLDQGGVTVGRPEGSAVRLEADRPMLIVPGEPLSPQALSALGPLPAPRRAGARPSPALPQAIRPGVRVRDFRVAEVRAAPGGHDIVLAREGERAIVRARVGEGDLEVGRWGVAIEPSEGLSPQARVAVGLLLRALEGA